MKITKTNKEFDAMLGAIKAIASDKLNLPAKVCYQLAKNRIAIEDALKAYKESYEAIVKRYAKEGEMYFKINKADDPETFEKVEKEFKEIGDETSTADVTPISIDAFDGHDVPFTYINALMDIIKDGDD